MTRITSELDDRGAWSEPSWVRDANGTEVEPDDGIIRSQAFIDNVITLCQFIRLASQFH